ncbi:MAG: protein kinase, partial [Verrucomicrobia bacterium]|nr:protein kinase [Verrucomicrobiota bacterium]
MADADLLVGQRINNHVIVERIGQGGMGVVYRARHTTLERDVAIKFLSPHLVSTPGYVDRFIREARAAARLNHPGLIAVYDAGMEGETHYMIMEYVVGCDLSHKLKERILFPEPDVIRFGRMAAEALDFAHQRGIIHRDIKPENLLLDQDGRIRIADLGLAKLLKEDELSRTMSGMVLGTPYYISPEQVCGSRDVDARSDIYSLGLTLFHLATGQIPFRGGSAAEIMAKHLSEECPSARSVNPSLSDAFSRFLARMAAKERADRCQSMAEVLLGLKDISHEEASRTALDHKPETPVARPATQSPKRVFRPPAKPVIEARERFPVSQGNRYYSDPDRASPGMPIVTRPDPALEEVDPRKLSAHMRQALKAEEKAIYKAEVHWIVLLRPIVGVLALAGAVLAARLYFSFALFPAMAAWLVLAALVLTAKWMECRALECVVTNKRVLSKSGVLRPKTEEALVEKVGSIEIDQGALGKYLDYGEVRLSGTDGPLGVYPGISQPRDFKKTLRKAQSAACRSQMVRRAGIEPAT